MGLIDWLARTFFISAEDEASAKAVADHQQELINRQRDELIRSRRREAEPEAQRVVDRRGRRHVERSERSRVGDDPPGFSGPAVKQRPRRPGRRP